MENWEFLLQKEGDRAWHSIKKPKVAIQEGKYRIAAHTCHPNSEIEIRVAYQTTGENPPKRRVQKRSRSTNKDGLMVVIPFTYLKPGLWELSWTSETIQGLSGEKGQPWIQFKVLPKVTKTISQPATSKTVEEVKPQPSEETGNLGQTTTDNPIFQESLENLEQVLHQVFDSFLEEFDEPEFLLEMSKPLPEGIAPPSTPARVADIPSPPSSSDRQEELVLTLNPNNFVAHRGSAITLSGELNSTQPSHSVFRGYLGIKLSHPQNAQILLEKSQPLPPQVPPLTFSCNLELPSECQTYLLLGEVSVYNSAELALASQPFSVTVNLEELVGGVLKQQGDRIEAIVQDPIAPATPEEERNSVHLHAAFEEISPTPNTLRPLQAAPNRPLPPPIKKPTGAAKPSKSPELPSLPKPQPPAITPKQIVSETDVPASVEESVSEAIKKETPTQPEQPTAIDNAFQSLKLEERFWSRLNTLAVDGELSEWLRVEQLPLNLSRNVEEEIAASDTETARENRCVDRELIQQDLAQKTTDSELEAFSEDLNPLPNLDRDSVIPPDETQTAIPQQSELQPEATSLLEEFEEAFKPSETSIETSEEEIDWSEREIVVDDDLSAPEQGISKLQYPPSFLEDRPVPTPDLLIPSSELIAGELITIGVTLPATSVSLYVKLWIQDRQTRYILDAPRNLLDFSLNASGILETSTEIIVPVSSLEIRFEAIAIDSVTQRESHKASIDRFVVSPSDKDFSIEDFEEERGI